MVALDDAWTRLEPPLTTDDFTAFETAVLKVLAETDPPLDLDEQERWRAGLLGIRPRFSADLRQGLALSLAAVTAGGPDRAGPGGASRCLGRIGRARDLRPSQRRPELPALDIAH